MIAIEPFLQELAEDNRRFYEETPPELKTYWPHKLTGAAAIEALKARWFNEYIGTVVLARLLEKVDQPQLKMMIGRQVGDEAKHAMVCAKRISQLGGKIEDYEPLPEQIEMYEILDSYQHPEEFLASMQFTTEAEGVRRNEQALTRFDAETASVFAEAINPDEVFHVQIGWAGLRILCTNELSQERAKLACHRGRELHRKWVATYKKKMESSGLFPSSG